MCSVKPSFICQLLNTPFAASRASNAKASLMDRTKGVHLSVHSLMKKIKVYIHSINMLWRNLDPASTQDWTLNIKSPLKLIKFTPCIWVLIVLSKHRKLSKLICIPCLIICELRSRVCTLFLLQQCRRFCGTHHRSAVAKVHMPHWTWSTWPGH